MKKSRWVTIYQLILSTVLFLVIVITFVAAQPDSNAAFVVMATVLPERSIVVDQDLNIQQIYSNTKQDVRPNVYQDRIDGSPVAYSDSIRGQYDDLKSSIDFSKPGQVYKRPASSTGSFFRSVVNFFKRLLGF